jgi:hypothetical protein
MAKLPIHQDRWWRILDVSFVMYVLSYIDRTNIVPAQPRNRTDDRQPDLRLRTVSVRLAHDVPA